MATAWAMHCTPEDAVALARAGFRPERSSVYGEVWRPAESLSLRIYPAFNPATGVLVSFVADEQDGRKSPAFPTAAALISWLKIEGWLDG